MANDNDMNPPRSWRYGSTVLFARGRGAYPYDCRARDELPDAMVYYSADGSSWDHEFSVIYEERERAADNID